jgi:hypothetical protein
LLFKKPKEFEIKPQPNNQYQIWRGFLPESAKASV